MTDTSREPAASKGRYRVFASCAPGLEPHLANEVGALGLVGLEAGAAETPGGVELTCDLRALHRLLLELGLASHVLVRVAQFPVRELGALEAHVARLPWSGWLRRGEPRRVRAHSQHSRIFHTGAIEERVERAIRARLGDDPAHDADPDSAVPIHVRMFEDRCMISLDVGGEPLHRRGYRHDPHRAPLREDLAHALVRASRWDLRRPLVDPMCGSGTLVIEAARLAARHAPGLERDFAISRTALADDALLTELRDEARSRIVTAGPLIVARDRDARAVVAARANAERAGVSAQITFDVGPLSGTRESLVALGSEGPVTVVTNPPWGERLGAGSDLAPLYGAIGSLVRAIPGSTLTLAAHDRKLAYATGVPLESALLTDLGGTKVAIMRSRGGRASGETPADPDA